MAKKDLVNQPKELVEATPEEVAKLEKDIEKIKEELPIEGAEAQIEKPKFVRLSPMERRAQREAETHKRNLEMWIPKTELGKLVKHGKIKDFDKVLNESKRILEPEITDTLIPNLETDLSLIGQAKGKFGGGKRRAWKQTQKKTMESNIISFACMAIVGDKKGHIGVGYGKAKETLPSREKAIRDAKLNVIRISRGFESPALEPEGAEPHTIPFVVHGKCGSVKIKMLPAPRGTGLVIADEGKKVLRLAGIKDVFGITEGETRTTFNLVKACIDALSKTNKMRS